MGAIVEGNPRVFIPSQRRPRCGSPGALRRNRQASEKEEIDALSAKKKDEPRALKPASGAIRLLTCNLWGGGPLFDARLGRPLWRFRKSCILFSFSMVFRPMGPIS